MSWLGSFVNTEIGRGKLYVYAYITITDDGLRLCKQEDLVEGGGDVRTYMQKHAAGKVSEMKLLLLLMHPLK